MAYVLHRFYADLPYQRPPGLTIWHYIRLREGIFAAASQAGMDRFFNGEASAPVIGDDTAHLRLYTAEVVRSTKIIQAEFFTKLKLLPDGYLDYDDWLKGCGYSPHWVLAAVQGHDDEATKRVRARFNEDHRWEPTSADLDGLVQQILREKRPPVWFRSL